MLKRKLAVNAPVLQPLTIPTSAMPDVDIVVPPTPTHQLLPLSETDGLTSGAVQPPGSTGENLSHSVLHHRVARDSGEESDSSFTDDGNFHELITVDEVEDEEQRLIRLGGSGIPTGPVSALRRSSPRNLPLIVPWFYRTDSRSLYYRPSPRNTLGGNAWCSTWTRPSCTAV